ncbi:PspC domain-containing protein [Actinoplanes sp. NPDC049681]|uniref:PspC domain-containing protein n=1 Tax=Actinoplanes sp. NPDC049681 TaxID=3363905 RepID=UPI00379DBA72
MTDEAAQSREAAGSSQDAPAPSSTPPAGDVPPAYEPPAADAPPAPDAPPPPPPGATPPPGNPPPWFGAPDGPVFSREKLIRPRSGRYVAGVCGAIGQATNTDPVLWRVLIAVLGFFGGVGILIYLVGWLMIPAEGDTASPVESLLGRGRSGMAPLSVVVLGAAAALSFAFVVQDGFRATLLAAAVLVCGALVLKKSTRPGPAPAADPWAATATFPPATPTAPATPETPAAGPTGAFAAAGAPAPTAAPAGEPVTEPLPPLAPTVPPTSSAPPAPPWPPASPKFGPPNGGYRPPFAPHGPWAQGSGQPPHGSWQGTSWPQGAGHPPYAPPAPKRAPKRPRERSKLGRITFFGVVVVMGILAAVDLAGANIPVSGYFAAALATIALGLIVGAWFGRARGLIFLAVLATIGLSISTGVERFGGEFANNTYRPQTLAAVADRYDFSVGNATLDLRALDFTGQDQSVTVAMKFGQVRVLLPDDVDATTSVSMDDGRALIYGRELTGRQNVQGVTDLGPDGKGGGTLRLAIQMDTGNVEVTR